MSTSIELVNTYGETVFNNDITYNLTSMAKESELYIPIYVPHKYYQPLAKNLILPLMVGYNLLKSDRKRFEQFNPSNGWGNYNDFVEFVGDYLLACIAHPYAKVIVT